MQTNTLFSYSWRGVLCLSLVVWLSALSAPMAGSAALAETASAAVPVISAEMAQPMLQFAAGGHVVGFAPRQMVLASLDHALRVEFVGTEGVTPVVAGAEDSPPPEGLTKGHAQPLDVVTYPELWPGISVEYHASEGSIIKSTYKLAPGADEAQIRLRYNVPAELQSDGSLQFHFERGEMIESAPIAWQDIDGRRVFVPVAFTLTPLPFPEAGEGSEVTFRLGSYDPRYPLTIDPYYAWHTFYGSADGWDEGHGIVVDGSGNVYIVGSSGATWGIPLHAYSGDDDIVVVKLNSAGAYQWHTFYGSSYSDVGYGIAVDGGGNVYITGNSLATWQGGAGNNISPLHPHNENLDIVVLKLTSTGAYQWHTFYGSASYDYGLSIAVDGSGSNIYVTGFSAATWQGDNNINPLHAYSGADDIVVMKLNSAGAYQWHTFYGSAEYDFGNDIAIDGNGSVYITGISYTTWQGNNNTNPLHPHNGQDDIAVLKLNSDGAYQWHTFYGAVGNNDYGYGIAVDGNNNVYITGCSAASWQGDGGADPKHEGSGYTDIVVVKLNNAGAYQWHTFYGGDNPDIANGIAVDGNGNVYITGYSYVTWLGDNNTNPLHAHSGVWDIVVVSLDNAGTYQWHTFYGSVDVDFGNGIALQGNNVYIAGYSDTTWQGDNNANPLHAHSGDRDIIALKIGTLSYPYRLHLPLILKGN